MPITLTYTIHPLSILTFLPYFKTHYNVNISVLPREDLSLAMYNAMQARGFAAEAPIYEIR
jgi:hypothetical protein